MNNMDRAKTIMTHLGATNAFRVMTGAKDFLATMDGLRFRIPRRIVNITLKDDLYVVEVLSPKGNVMKREEGIYCDNLRDAFRRLTGLATSL